MWHATDDMRLYAAASRGFRAGGLQPGFNAPGATRVAPDRFKADSLWNYELGWRSDWFDGATHLDVTGFLSKWKNPQTLQVGSGAVPSSYLDNAGGVESRGVEGALQTLLPLEGLSLLVSAAYTKTVTTKDFIGFDGSNVPVGTSWPYAPRWQTATTLAYARSVGAWELGAGVTHLYLGKARNDLVESRSQDVFGFEQWNLNFNVARPSWTWAPELSLAVDNLDDERGISFRFDSGAYTDVAYIRPRSVTLRLAGHF
jgi:outer membrane receptor protein involved in Fe transport